MFKNYLKVAYRDILRYKGYSLINIFGLALGIASCMLIFQFISDELSYDTFHKDADKIYRVVENYKSDIGETIENATSYTPLKAAMEIEFPEFEEIVRVFPKSVLLSRDNQSKFQEDSFIFADSGFFNVFNFSMIKGNSLTALDEPFSVVLTKSIADKYFGNEDPIGEIIHFENKYDFIVTGIINDVSHNSHFKFNFVASFSSLNIIQPWINSWHWPPLYTYAKVGSNKSINAVESRMRGLVNKYLPIKERDKRTYHLQSLTDIHLYSHRKNEYKANGDITYIYMFSVIVVFLLAIASINFMNLSTAKAHGRAREVGIRKVMGSHRIQLIKRFLTESILITFIAVLFALGLIELFFPLFNSIAGKELSISYFSNWEMPMILFGLIIIVGTISGSYPAFYLSSFQPTKVMKGLNIKYSLNSLFLRKGLVVFQFVISSILIVGTLIFYNQLDFIRNKKLGFNKDHIVVLPLRDYDDNNDYRTLKNSLMQNSEIISVSASSGVPGREGIHDFLVKPKNASKDSLEMMILSVDHDFGETFNLELVEGRDFSEKHSTDVSQAFLLNESAARLFGWSENPLDRELTLNWYTDNLQIKSGKVVGVVKDFHYNSLHNQIDPLVIHISNHMYYIDFISVKISGHDVKSSLNFINRKWEEYDSDRPFEYFFLDEEYNKIYKADERLGEIFLLFAILAIVIACLGLFGLASFTIEQKTKEIGVRKILGASIYNIVILLSKNFIALVLIAFIISAPIAYLLLNSLLENFAYRINISAGIFLYSATVVFLFTFLTIIYQSLKAATTNPVDNLRND